MRRYLILVAVCAVITVLMSIKDLALLILMVTLGLAFPLMFAATALLYLLCAYPAVTLWRNGGRERLLGLGLSAIAMLAAAILPGAFARWNVAAGAAELRAGDTRPVGAIAVGGLEIRRPNGSNWNEGSGREPCGQACRALLLGGKVEWVRVVQPRPHDRKSPDTRTFHKIETGASCSVPGSPKPADEKCVVMAMDHGGAADLVLRFEQSQPLHAATGNFDLVRWHGTRRISAHRRQGDQWSEVLRQTAVDADVVSSPTAIGVKFIGMGSKGQEFWRTRHRANHLELADALAMLGLDASAGAALAAASGRPRNWKDSINDTMTRELIAVLDLRQTTPFNTEQQRVISDWVKHARQVKQWSPELIGLLRRIVRDGRIGHASFFDQVFERNRSVTEALLPDVLEILESRGVTGDHAPARQVVYTFPRIDPALLKPHRERIVALMAGNAELAGILRPAAGRLGVDPLPLLQPLSADLDPTSRRHARGLGRLKGACHAERQWAPQLIPVLRAALAQTQTYTDKRALGEYQPALLKTLANLGDTAFVQEQLALREGKDIERLASQIRSGLDPRRGADSLCYF